MRRFLISLSAPGYFSRENMLAIRARVADMPRGSETEACPELSKERAFPTEDQIQERIRRVKAAHRQIMESDDDVADIGLTLKQPLTFFAKNSEDVDLLKNPESIDFTLSQAPSTPTRSEASHKLLTCSFQSNDFVASSRQRFNPPDKPVHPLLKDLSLGSANPSSVQDESFEQTSKLQLPGIDLNNRIIINSRFNRTTESRFDRTIDTRRTIDTKTPIVNGLKLIFI